jgi:glucose-6-phosphate dehydrogenase assembly protein OpcA
VSPPGGPTSVRPGRFEEFTSGKDIGVDVSSIERELGSLWRQASGASAELAVTRACSWNLLVHVSDQVDIEIVRALIDKVVAAVPSRAIVLVPSAVAGGKEIEAFVSANCQIAPGGGKLLCSEEITIQSYAGGDKHVPALVRALLVPDLPTALFWAGIPPKDPRQIAYFPSVDRLVFDSSRGDSNADFTAFATLPRDKVLVDIAWLRTGFLRSMLASLFDPPTGAEPLGRVGRLRITATPSGLTGARLYAGWLATRLGWKLPPLASLTRENPALSGTAADGQPLVIELGFAEDRPRESGIAEILLETRGPAPAQYSLADLGDGTLLSHASGLNSHSQVAADLALERLVVAALGTRGRDSLFRSALERVTGATAAPAALPGAVAPGGTSPDPLPPGKPLAPSR